MKRIVTLAAVITAPMCLCSAGVFAGDGDALLHIRNVESSARSLAVDGEPLRIRLHVSGGGILSLAIANDLGEIVREFKANVASGYNQFVWNGRDSEDKAVPSGVYRYTIASGRTLVYGGNPTSVERLLPVYDLRVDAATGMISYKLPQPARVSIRLGVSDGGPLIRTLLNGLPQDAGLHSVKWDGWDESRAARFERYENILASVEARSIADNAIIVTSDDPHKQRSNSLSFRLEFVDAGSDPSSPVVKDLLQALIETDEDIRAILASERFEWAFFIDHRFVFEEEDAATNPYTFKLDVGGLPEGEHVLTVNLLSQTDSAVGCHSRRFTIKR